MSGNNLFNSCTELNGTTCSTCTTANIQNTSDKCFWNSSSKTCSAFQDSGFSQTCADDKPGGSSGTSTSQCNTNRDCRSGGVCQYNTNYLDPQKRCYFPCTSDETCKDLGASGTCQKPSSCTPGTKCTSYCKVTDSVPGQGDVTLDYIRGQIDNNISNNKESVDKLLKDIEGLQGLEQYLIGLLSNRNLSEEERNVILEKIEGITQMRMSLYKNLVTMTDSGSNSADLILSDQKASIDVMENELNRLKSEMTNMDQKNLNKLRMIQINSYYSKRYENHTKVLKMVLLFVILFSILYFFRNKGLLPDIVFTILLFILVALCVYFVGKGLLDMWMRDNMNYDEYDWMFNTKSAPKISSVPNGISFSGLIDLGICPSSSAK